MSEEVESDESLMLRYAQGEAPAFEQLYARHKGGLFRYLRRQCAPSVAEELFQDVWMRVVAARSAYTVQARFATYLYHIAHNRLVDHYRVSARRPEESLDTQREPGLAETAGDGQSGPEQLAGRRQLAERLLGCLEALPDEQREAFLMREEAGLGVAEIAEATGVGRETAKSRLRYAVVGLRRCLGTLP